MMRGEEGDDCTGHENCDEKFFVTQHVDGCILSFCPMFGGFRGQHVLVCFCSLAIYMLKQKYSFMLSDIITYVLI